MKKLLSIISLLVISLSSQSLFADGNSPGSVSLSLAGGYYYFDSGRDLENKATPVVILGFNFTDRWGFEALLASFSTHFKRSVNDTRRVSSTMVAFDGVYRFCNYNHLQPYALAGVGILGLNPNQTEANNQGNINAGLGVEYFFYKNMALRLDVRDFYTIVAAKNDVMWNAGITFLFDLC